MKSTAIFLLATLTTGSFAETEVVDGITWTYTISGDTASIGTFSFSTSLGEPPSFGASYRVISNETAGSITIPSSLGEKAVTGIGIYAFYGCSKLTSITVPDSVTKIGDRAFYGCSSLTSTRVPNGETTIGREAFSGCSKLTDIEIPQCVCATNLSVFFPSWRTMTNIVVAEGVGYIADSAFEGCVWLERVTVPWTVTRIGQRAFYDCIRLREVVFGGDAPDRIGEDVFGGTQRLLVCLVPDQSIGWDGGVSTMLPDSWNGRGIAVGSQQGHGAGGGSPGGGAASVVRLSVSNIVVHYVTQSIPSDAVIPSTTSGIVNIVAEVGAGGAVAIPSEWAAQYPDFETRFGSDFSAALTAETGKRDGADNPMLVWQDYVAGTDPTDPTSVFTASITFDAETGDPVIGWSPELSAAEATKRKYTILGKVRLNDDDWTEVDGDEADYNFFKVRVEMK